MSKEEAKNVLDKSPHCPSYFLLNENDDTVCLDGLFRVEDLKALLVLLGKAL